MSPPEKITGIPLALPIDWVLVHGYLIGPNANRPICLILSTFETERLGTLTNMAEEEFPGLRFHLLNPLWFMNSQMRPIQV